MASLQSKFINNETNEFNLELDQYKGPLIIDHPCTINGHGSTIWCKKGPVIIINSNNVKIRDLNVEVTERNMIGLEKVAIQTNYPDIRFSNVKVVGEVKGLNSELDWKLPIKFDLGKFDPNEYKTYLFPVRPQQRVTVLNNCKDINVSPEVLEPGVNNIKIQYKGKKNTGNLYGEICLCTGGLFRVIPVVGKPVSRI